MINIIIAVWTRLSCRIFIIYINGYNTLYIARQRDYIFFAVKSTPFCSWDSSESLWTGQRYNPAHSYTHRIHLLPFSSFLSQSFSLLFFVFVLHSLFVGILAGLSDQTTAFRHRYTYGGPGTMIGWGPPTDHKIRRNVRSHRDRCPRDWPAYVAARFGASSLSVRQYCLTSNLMLRIWTKFLFLRVFTCKSIYIFARLYKIKSTEFLQPSASFISPLLFTPFVSFSIFFFPFSFIISSADFL